MTAALTGLSGSRCRTNMLRLCDLLKVKGDPATVDRNHTLADQFVVCNLRVCKWAQRSDRANELSGFGRRFRL
jgi:FKBP-type peptidyl-prolyl cis-trans isomerase 2